MQTEQVAKHKNPRQAWLVKPIVPWRIRDIVVILAITAAVPIALALFWYGLKHLPLPLGISTTVNNKQIVEAIIDLATLATEFGLLYWLVKKYHAPRQTLGLNSFSWWRFLFFVGAGLILLTTSVILIFSLIVWLVPSFNADQAQNNALTYGSSGVGLWLSFVAAVVVAPIVEELYFRGVILPVFMRRFGTFFGILLTSVLFALLHFQPNVVVYTFILAIILAIIRLRLKSVIPSMLLHAFNNLIAFSIIAGWLH